MPNLVAELNSLDFSVYIGGPLQAAVQAQHAASMSTVQFIQDVGFVTTGAGTSSETTDLRYVTFKYNKVEANPNFDPLATSGPTSEPMRTIGTTIEVPFLTMLVIPSLRIDEITIDFNAKLTSTETSSASSQFAADVSLGIDYKVVNFKASASYKSSTASGTSIEKTYNLGVKVRAVNDELPAGLDRILTLLESSIKSS